MAQSQGSDSSKPARRDASPSDLPAPQSHRTRQGPGGHKATQFDGSPQQQPSEDAPSGLKPRDDTPAVLKKREGPANKK